MPKIRKLTLQEWFMTYQLDHNWFSYHHLPFTMDIEVTQLVEAAESLGLRFSPTAAVVKAASLLLVERPELNRMLFHTLFGPRMLELDVNRVNMPVIIDNGGDPVLSAMVFEDAHSKSVADLHTEIRNFSKSDLSDKPIGRFVATRGNWWWNRMALRLLHFVAHRMPSVYATRGGGISVTSLMRRNTQGLIWRGIAIGQTAITFCLCGLQKSEDGRYTIQVGVDYNHSVFGGDAFSEACKIFGELLSAQDPSVFYPELKATSDSSLSEAV